MLPIVRAKSMLIRLLVIALICYGALAAMLFVFQERLVFLPAIGDSRSVTPADRGMEYQEVWLLTEDGERLHAWWLRSARPRGTVLFSHGNAGNISHRLDSLRIFHTLHMNVLIYDYRGYGRSPGRASESGSYRDIMAAWRWLLEEEGVATGTVFLFGRSLGGAVSAWLAERVDAGGLILESTFTSIPDLGAELYWWLPVRWFSRIRYATIERMACIDMPVLLIHSRDDEIIPFVHAERLQAAAGGKAELLELSGSHNTAFMESADRYRSGLAEFFHAALP